MAGRMLEGGYLAVMEAKTLAEFSLQLVRFAEELDFKFINALVVTDHSPDHSDFQTVDNTPAAYADVYRDLLGAQRDPVMQHCKRAAIPIVWDQHTYVSQGAGDYWECQAKYGYATGVAMALHLPGGRHFFMGVDRDRPLSKDVRAMTRVVADLQLFAVHAQDAAFRIFPSQPAKKADDTPTLTPRELEALRWTMEGKTAWEVGAIMSISERTAVLHLQNSMRKLSSVNKHQAVLKALRLGLLK
jgi:DNA-binding CsgD family transcriptional regulator